MAAQKYVRLKNRDGHVIDWHRNLNIVPDDMEVFESEVQPPENIPDLVEWMVSAQNQKVERAAKRGKAVEEKVE